MIGKPSMGNWKSRIRRLSTIPFIVICLSVGSGLYADRHSEAEIKKLLNDVETAFNDYIHSGVNDYAPLETQRARKYIEAAKKMLSQDERDSAYYELKKAAAHFRLFDAKRKMVNAELELDQAVKGAR